MTGIALLREVVQELEEYGAAMVFTGGLVLPLYLELQPPFRIRVTDDADAVVACTTHHEWARFQMELKKVGIEPVVGEPEAPICRMRTARGHLLDVMPMDPDVLGFGNCWFRLGFETAMSRSIGDHLSIRIFPPVVYAAAKAEAYRGRGQDDPWVSHDLEDLLTLIACRPGFPQEVSAEGRELRGYMAALARELLSLDRVDELVDGAVGERADEVIAALEAIAQL